MDITQNVWRWKIALYMFGEGLASSCYIMGMIFDIMGFVFLAKTAILVSIPLLIISTLFLIWDLGLPKRLISNQPFGNLFSNWRRSWISRGSITVSLFIVLGFINIIFWIWPFSVLETAPGLRLCLEAACSILAIITILYTGILIGVMVGRPLWNTPLIPVLFMVSSFLTGIGIILLGLPLLKGFITYGVMKGLYLSAVILIMSQIVILCFYLGITYRSSPEKVEILIKGRLKELFWVGIIIIGLTIPLFINLLNISMHETVWKWPLLLSSIGGIFILMGGLFLRGLILFSGTRSAVIIGGVPFFIRPEV